MTDKPTRPVCGNNPQTQALLTDGDRQAVADFRAYLATRTEIAITAHRLALIRDAARLYRQQLIGTSELYAVIEADESAQPLPAGFRHDLVVAVKCAVCEYEFDEDESYTVHFQSVEQATKTVLDAGWTALSDGRVICDSDEPDHRTLRPSTAEAQL